MDKHEAQRKKREGDQILEALGDVPVAYGFTCELPAAHGEPLHDLDRLWYDHFEVGGRTWCFILNGDDDIREIESIELLLEAGAAFVICDNSLLAKLTPPGVDWFFDPDTGDSLTADVDGDNDVRYWDDHLIETLHARLTEKGKDLPDLQEIVSNEN